MLYIVRTRSRVTNLEAITWNSNRGELSSRERLLSQPRKFVHRTREEVF